MSRGQRGDRLKNIRGFIGALYGPDLHAKRVESLAGATLGVMAVAPIGQALAQACGLVTRHAVKQVDRLMSNRGIDVWDSFARWVPQQVGGRADILVAMDWTDLDGDGQSTLVLSLVTGHSRAAAVAERLEGGDHDPAQPTRTPACGGWPRHCPRTAG